MEGQATRVRSTSATLPLPLEDARATLPPPLKWAGGKRWQLPHLRPLVAEHRHRRLVEPFCGGMAVTLGLSPERALVNDINPHLVNFYRQVKKGLELDIPVRNSKRTYDRNRNRFNALIAAGEHETAEAAALFYYLNRTGFNGLCRFNRKGGFNVPFGRSKTIAYRCDFSEYQRLFRGWSFMCRDFADLPVGPDDLIYADPPYDVQFTQYSADGFTWEDQVRVAEWLAEHPGPVVLTNQATTRIVALYRKLGFTLKFLNAPRMISCNGDRTPAREVIATKNL